MEMVTIISLIAILISFIGGIYTFISNKRTRGINITEQLKKTELSFNEVSIIYSKVEGLLSHLLSHKNDTRSDKINMSALEKDYKELMQKNEDRLSDLKVYNDKFGKWKHRELIEYDIGTLKTVQSLNNKLNQYEELQKIVCNH